MVKWIKGELLGRGGFAAVHAAIVADDDGRRATPAAVKSSSLRRSATLRAEKSALARLAASPRVVRCLGDAESGGRYHLFLELAAGGSLSDALRRRRSAAALPPLPDLAVRRVARSVAEGLRDVHAAGYAHCDVKPENILLFGPGGAPRAEELQHYVVKIGDFGLAKPAGRQIDVFQGTAIYSSPEKASRNEHEPPGDVWALGCVVAEMASGRPPWSECYTNNEVRDDDDDDEDDDDDDDDEDDDDEDEEEEEDEEDRRVLDRIAAEEPEIPAGMSEEGKDFLRRGCFERDPERRWTAEMLLAHPFLNPPPDGGGGGGGGGERSPELDYGPPDLVDGSQEMRTDMEVDGDGADDMEEDCF